MPAKLEPAEADGGAQDAPPTSSDDQPVLAGDGSEEMDAGAEPSELPARDQPPSEAPDTTPATTATKTVGTRGGTLVLQSTARVEVPASALIEEVQLTAREIPASALPLPLPLNAVSSAVELTPHGRLFDYPITIMLPYDRSATVANLAVLRLDDPTDVDWEPVENVRFEDGFASFESTTFSYYTVVTYPEPVCSNLPTATAACAGTCTAQQYCSSAAVCTPIAQNSLCGNTKIYAMQSGEVTVDNPSASEIAAALASHCTQSALSTAISDTTVVQPCSSELLIGGGNTLVFAGGPATNPALRYLDRRISPVFIDTDGAQQQFKTRAGSVLVAFDPASVTPSHDFFMIQLFPDTARGALVVSAFGREGPGTRAATYYFINTVLPAIKAGTRSWAGYTVVEWTDSGDLIPNAADSFVVRASEALPPPPPPPPVTPPPPSPETPYQATATGTLATSQSVNAAAGYKFTPQANGKVTALGGFFSGTKTVKLFKGSTVLATASVSSSNAWVYKDITPVALTAGTQYTVAVYLAGSGGAKRTSGPTLPKVVGNIRIDAPTQASTTFLTPNAVPTTSSSPTTTMLGLADVRFLKD